MTFTDLTTKLGDIVRRQESTRVALTRAGRKKERQALFNRLLHLRREYSNVLQELAAKAGS